jgi:hypothetical protein
MLSAQGKQAIQEAREIRNAMWNDLTEIVTIKS